MIRYSTESSYQIFVKYYGFLSFARSMSKISEKTQVKTSAVDKVRNLLIMPNNL